MSEYGFDPVAQEGHDANIENALRKRIAELEAEVVDLKQRLATKPSEAAPSDLPSNRARVELKR